MKQHLMIDFETLATSTDAVVLSLGSALFNKEKVLYTNYMEFQIEPQIAEHGRRVQADTLAWWMRQGDKARKVFESEQTKWPLKDAMQAYKGWIRGAAEDYSTLNIWSNGATFDIPILTHLLLSFGHQPFWSYKNERCMREYNRYTNVKQMKLDVYAGGLRGVEHNALDDAVWQAESVMLGLQKFGDA